MNLLLDTHIFLWWLSNRTMLSPETRAMIGDPANRVVVSVVSFWELAIKVALGRLLMPEDIAEVSEANGFVLLPVHVQHALGVMSLPHHHKDPFDRLLVAQAMHEGFTLVSRDPWIHADPIATVSA